MVQHVLVLFLLILGACQSQLSQMSSTHESWSEGRLVHTRQAGATSIARHFQREGKPEEQTGSTAAQPIGFVTVAIPKSGSTWLQSLMTAVLGPGLWSRYRYSGLMLCLKSSQLFSSWCSDDYNSITQICPGAR